MQVRSVSVGEMQPSIEQQPSADLMDSLPLTGMTNSSENFCDLSVLISRAASKGDMAFRSEFGKQASEKLLGDLVDVYKATLPVYEQALAGCQLTGEATAIYLVGTYLTKNNMPGSVLDEFTTLKEAWLSVVKKGIDKKVNFTTKTYTPGKHNKIIDEYKKTLNDIGEFLIRLDKTQHILSEVSNQIKDEVYELYRDKFKSQGINQIPDDFLHNKPLNAANQMRDIVKSGASNRGYEFMQTLVHSNQTKLDYPVYTRKAQQKTATPEQPATPIPHSSGPGTKDNDNVVVKVNGQPVSKLPGNIEITVSPHIENHVIVPELQKLLSDCLRSIQGQNRPVGGAGYFSAANVATTTPSGQYFSDSATNNQPEPFNGKSSTGIEMKSVSTQTIDSTINGPEASQFETSQLNTLANQLKDRGVDHTSVSSSGSVTVFSHSAAPDANQDGDPAVNDAATTPSGQYFSESATNKQAELFNGESSTKIEMKSVSTETIHSTINEPEASQFETSQLNTLASQIKDRGFDHTRRSSVSSSLSGTGSSHSAAPDVNEMATLFAKHSVIIDFESIVRQFNQNMHTYTRGNYTPEESSNVLIKGIISHLYLVSDSILPSDTLSDIQQFSEIRRQLCDMYEELENAGEEQRYVREVVLDILDALKNQPCYENGITRFAQLLTPSKHLDGEIIQRLQALISGKENIPQQNNIIAQQKNTTPQPVIKSDNDELSDELIRSIANRMIRADGAYNSDVGDIFVYILPKSRVWPKNINIGIVDEYNNMSIFPPETAGDKDKKTIKLQHSGNGQNPHYNLYGPMDEIIAIPGDGNCFFHAFVEGLALYGYKIDMQTLRNSAADEFIEHPEEYKNWLDIKKLTEKLNTHDTVEYGAAGKVSPQPIFAKKQPANELATLSALNAKRGVEKEEKEQVTENNMQTIAQPNISPSNGQAENSMKTVVDEFVKSNVRLNFIPAAESWRQAHDLYGKKNKETAYADLLTTLVKTFNAPTFYNPSVRQTLKELYIAADSHSTGQRRAEEKVLNLLSEFHAHQKYKEVVERFAVRVIAANNLPEDKAQAFKNLPPAYATEGMTKTKAATDHVILSQQGLRISRHALLEKALRTYPKRNCQIVNNGNF
ncbi:OTU domain-containing protein [Mixta mediterraneensis]|uniref:OTU domain-containing protein n=1 Tax=Mixta mediterraneensis TaxID=2758443 RepID=UPI0018769D7B|nr:OTU domain-containing protein [Mixta mediterraneensis]MBE5251933.1 hypothetical protein [Mixta mediterraneensis]